MACIVNGSKRGRPGRWLVDWTDARGRRRIASFRTEEAAKRKLSAALLESSSRSAEGIDPRLTVTELADLFLELRGPVLGEQTVARYRAGLEKHVLPELGGLKLEHVRRLALEAWAAAMLRDGLAPATVAGIVSVARTIFEFAVKHGGMGNNPAGGLCKELGLSTFNRESIRALNEEQLSALLRAARSFEADYYEPLSFVAHTGLAAGEAFGVQWADLDLELGSLTVKRQAARTGKILDKLKTDARRGAIDIPHALAEMLKARQARIREEAFQEGIPTPPWVLAPEWGEKPQGQDVWNAYTRLTRALHRSLQHAGLPSMGLHGLRHTYISRLLAAGCSPAYVQRQARHASISMTVDRYGSWLPHTRPEELERLAVRTSAGLRLR